MHKLDSRLLDFTLEITSGCRHNCSGCKVDKDDNELPSQEEFGKIIDYIKDLKRNNVALMNLAIGPTDILSYGPLEELGVNKQLQEISRMFLKVALNCSFLTPNLAEYSRLASFIENLIPNGLVKFTVPIEITKINNKKYIETIYNNIATLESMLTSVKISMVYVVINYDALIKEYSQTDIDAIYNTSHLKLHKHTHTDFIIPHGRQNLRDPEVSASFLETIHSLNNLLLRTYATKSNDGNDFDLVELNTNEGEDWDVIYRNGEMYLPPFIVEAFTSFDESFKIPKPWSYEATNDLDFDNNLRSIEIAISNNICGSCKHMAKCAERGVQMVMDIVNSDKCISVLGLEGAKEVIR